MQQTRAILTTGTLQHSRPSPMPTQPQWADDPSPMLTPKSLSGFCYLWCVAEGGNTSPRPIANHQVLRCANNHSGFVGNSGRLTLHPQSLSMGLKSSIFFLTLIKFQLNVACPSLQTSLHCPFLTAREGTASLCRVHFAKSPAFFIFLKCEKQKAPSSPLKMAKWVSPEDSRGARMPTTTTRFFIFIFL